jgi:hypothetical protein
LYSKYLKIKNKKLLYSKEFLRTTSELVPSCGLEPFDHDIVALKIKLKKIKFFYFYKDSLKFLVQRYRTRGGWRNCWEDVWGLSYASKGAPFIDPCQGPRGGKDNIIDLQLLGDSNFFFFP